MGIFRCTGSYLVAGSIKEGILVQMLDLVPRLHTILKVMAENCFSFFYLTARCVKICGKQMCGK